MANPPVVAAKDLRLCLAFFQGETAIFACSLLTSVAGGTR